jgi:hypothetical protein
MGVFIVTAIGAVVVALLGLWSARNAKQENDAAKRSTTTLRTPGRTVDHAMKSPTQGSNLNKSSDDDPMRRALAGTSEQSRR